MSESHEVSLYGVFGGWVAKLYPKTKPRLNRVKCYEKAYTKNQEVTMESSMTEKEHPRFLKKKIKCEIFRDSMQNYKRYAIPKAQLIIADVPYNVGTNFYGSNPMWYKRGG